jgi:hypothetical protein
MCIHFIKNNFILFFLQQKEDINRRLSLKRKEKIMNKRKFIIFNI